MMPIAAEPPHPELAIRCPARKDLLAIVRGMVSEVSRRMGFSEQDCAQIEMAVDEAASNVVLHAYRGRTPPPEAGLQLYLRLEPAALTIRVCDQGLCRRPRRSLRGSSSIHAYARAGRKRYGGLGTLVMKRFMDEVVWATGPGLGTTVTLRKVLRAAMEQEGPSDDGARVRPGRKGRRK